MQKMVVYHVRVDPVNRTHILVLKDEHIQVYVPIWIGVFEAAAIEMAMNGVSAPRPMTYDLLNNMIQTVGVKVDKIEICDLINNTFYAKIYISRGDYDEWVIDARPSDAIALCLRCDAPIFVDNEIIEEKGIRGDPYDKQSFDDIQKSIAEMTPNDFNKTGEDDN